MRINNIDRWEQAYRPYGTDGATGTINEYEIDGERRGYSLYETYGKDLEFVRSHNNDKIWTIVDGDGRLYLSPGYHWVNRIAYVVCEVPVHPDDNISDSLRWD